MTTWIVVSDGGDDLPEHYGPFETLQAASDFEDRLIQHLIANVPVGPFRDGETTYVEALIPPTIIDEADEIARLGRVAVIPVVIPPALHEHVWVPGYSACDTCGKIAITGLES